MSNQSIAIIIPSKFESEFLSVPHHVSGMGKINVIHKIYELAKEGYDKIVLSGFCGGLKGVEIGEVVKPCLFVEGDYDVSPLEEYPHQLLQTGRLSCAIISQDSFLKTNPYTFDFDKAVTDMESYAFVDACLRLNIKYEVLKIVSDIVGENSEKDFLESCRKLASKLEKVINEISISS